MRKQLMDALHDAGRKLKGWDTAYAERLVPKDQMATSYLGTAGAMGRGVPLDQVYNSRQRINPDGSLRDPLPNGS